MYRISTAVALLALLVGGIVFVADAGGQTCSVKCDNWYDWFEDSGEDGCTHFGGMYGVWGHSIAGYANRVKYPGQSSVYYATGNGICPSGGTIGLYPEIGQCTVGDYIHQIDHYLCTDNTTS